MRPAKHRVATKPGKVNTSHCFFQIKTIIERLFDLDFNLGKILNVLRNFRQISEGTMPRYNFDLCIKGIIYRLQCGARFNQMTIQQLRYSGLFGNHRITSPEHVGRRDRYKQIPPV